MNSLVANFGDDEGNEVNFNGTVVQALMMMNGPDINDAVSRKDSGTVAIAMTSNKNLQGVINQLYLTTLNRRPTATEMATLQQRLPLRPQFRALDVRDPAGPYQDLFWALLNSNEFILNH